MRVHVAIGASLAGLGDFWYATTRVASAHWLMGQLQALPVGVESALASVLDSLKRGQRLSIREPAERTRSPQDLHLARALGVWTIEPPFIFDGPDDVLEEGIMLGGESTWGDYVYECDFQPLNRAAGFFLRADAGGTSGLMMQFTSSSLRRHQKWFGRYPAGEITEIPLPMSLERHRWYKVRFEAEGTTLKTYLDERLIDEWTTIPAFYRLGKVGFRLSLGEFSLYRNPRITVTKMAVEAEADNV